MLPKVKFLGQEMTEEEKWELETALERDVRDEQLDAMEREWQHEHQESKQ